MAPKPPKKKVFDHILGEHYTVFDGLGGMHVEDIYQDRNGLLWIATADGGVSRFDGANFDTFGLSGGMPHLTVMTIAEDQDGRLLFGTLGGGLAIHDGQELQVRTTEHGLPSNEILSLQPQADGSLRMLTGAGLAQFADGQCVEHMPEVAGRPLGAVYDMATDAAGTTWLATRERGVISLEGRSLSGDMGNNSIQWPWKFAQGPSGPLWIAFHHTGPEPLVGRYDPSSQQLELIEVEDHAEGAEAVQHGTRHVRVDDRGLLWMTRRGVLVYDGQAWHPFSTQSSDSHFSDTRLTYEDREGNIWLGLWGGGLVFCDPLSVQLYTQADGLPDSEVQCLGEDREGRLWVGTMGGLACRQDDRIRPVGPERTVSALVVDRQGQVWSGGSEGQVLKATGGDAEAIEVAATVHSGEVTGLWEDRAGRLNVCTAEGRLGRIERDRFTALALKEQFPRDCTVALQNGAGTLWLGLSRKKAAICYCEDGRFHTPAAAGVEDIADVRALCEYQGALWIGTENQGLFALDYASGAIRRFTVDQGVLSVNGISALMNDPQGSLWIGTSGGGVLRYDGQNFHTIRLGQGALENIVEAVVRDSRGRLWFGTRAGLIAYRPGETRPRILLRQVVAGQTWDKPQAVSCPDSTPEIQFHFQGISFRSGAGQMRYSHRLVGHGPAEEWSAFSPANEATYQNVPAGQFHFEVRTMDRDGLVSDIARLTVQVVPTQSRHLEQMLRAAHQGFISQSPAIAELLGKLDLIAETNMAVLVLGETGVGKGVLARFIHHLSPRRAKPFIYVNCGNLPAGLVESELFGHEKGAFTSAHAQRIGYFERANGGTLFLDEVGDLRFESQRVLLHILEEKHLTRVGGGKEIPVDVRIVAATNRDLKEDIRAGTFRGDLLHRLNEFSAELPPLRERREDISLLAVHFAKEWAQEERRSVPPLSDEVLAHLEGYPWPGNVRELEHVIKQVMVLSRGDVIQVEDLPQPAALSVEQGANEEANKEANKEANEEAKKWQTFDADARDEAEKQRILAALQTTNWRVDGPRGAARLLDMSAEKLRYRMRKHGLKRPKKSSK